MKGTPKGAWPPSLSSFVFAGGIQEGIKEGMSGWKAEEGEEKVETLKRRSRRTEGVEEE